jgi:glycerol kinase
VFIGGAVVQWLRDELKMIRTAEESEEVAGQVDNTAGVYLVPAFVGLGAPHWDMRARGILTGLTRGTTRAHIVRAALESISYQSADLLNCMESDVRTPIPFLKVDGGAAMNDLLMQHQADVLNKPVVRGKTLETTALGATFLAGLATGVWPDTERLKGIWRKDRVFEPVWLESERRERVSGWENAIKLTKSQEG